MFSEHTLKSSWAIRFICPKNIHAGTFFVIKCLCTPKFKVLRNEKNSKRSWFSQFISIIALANTVKSVRIRSYSGPHYSTPYLSVFSPNVEKCRKNEDQNNSEYGHFLHSEIYRNGLELWVSNVKICIDKWRRIK